MRTQAIRGLALLSLCLAAGVVSACNKREARGSEAVVAVTDFDIGRSIKPDATIDDNTTTFRPSDVVYVSIGTKGDGNGTLQARWLFGENQEIATESQELSPGKPRRVTFRLARPNGLAKGDYSVEITLNGVAQGNKKFKVE